MYIHKQQDETPLQRPSTNLNRQKNTLYLESLRYGVILHVKHILKTIEDSCMKCLRRKKSFLKQSLGQPLQINFQKVIRPFQYIQMDLTGRHIAAGGEEIYGLICICLQIYNTRIYGIQNMKIESISLALEVLIQEVAPQISFLVIMRVLSNSWQRNYIRRKLEHWRQLYNFREIE